MRIMKFSTSTLACWDYYQLLLSYLKNDISKLILYAKCKLWKYLFVTDVFLLCPYFLLTLSICPTLVPNTCMKFQIHA